MMSTMFEGKNIVITGAGGRLGQRLVHGFIEAGATVAAVNRSDRGIPVHDRVQPFLADLSDEAAVADAFAQIAAQVGRVDALVHTVGMWDGRPLLETTLADWQKVMTINLTSAFLCTREAVRHMQDGGGRIVLIGAGQGVDRGRSQQAAYSASKAGVLRLAEAVTEEYADAGITAHILAPSMILFGDTSDKGVPADDLVALTQTLCSELGAAVNGATIRAYGTMR